MSGSSSKDIQIWNDRPLMFCFGGYNKIFHYYFKNVHDDIQNVEPDLSCSSTDLEELLNFGGLCRCNWNQNPSHSYGVSSSLHVFKKQEPEGWNLKKLYWVHWSVHFLVLIVVGASVMCECEIEKKIFSEISACLQCDYTYT